MSTLAASLHAAFHEPGTRIYRWAQGTVWALIVLSISFLVIEALLPEGSPAGPALRQLDRAILGIFAVEILMLDATFPPSALKVFHRPPIGRLRAHVLARLGFAARPMSNAPENPGRFMMKKPIASRLSSRMPLHARSSFDPGSPIPRHHSRFG